MPHYAVAVATFNRSDDGVWTVTLDESDQEERNPFYDEAVPRYLAALDPPFAKASEQDEAEFIKALLHVRSMQDAGWDAYDTTLRAVPSMMRLHGLIPPGDEWYETSRHLALWTWGHVVEASEPFALVADMLDIANGGFFHVDRFPERPLPGAKPGDLWPATRPQSRGDKMAELERLASAVGMSDVLTPMKEIWDRELRNAVFHADYTIHGSETRIPAKAKTYTHEEIQTLVNRALAYHEALVILRRAYRSAYVDPVTVTIKARSEDQEDELGVVMVRDGAGAIGLKHPHTAEEVAAGAIAWHMALLFPDEAEAVRADPTLAHFPPRPGV
jgi:hypothetical protein